MFKDPLAAKSSGYKLSISVILVNREYKPVVKIKVYFQGKMYYMAVVYACVKVCLIFTPKRDWKFRGTPEIKSMWIKHSNKFQWVGGGGDQSD